MKITELNNLNSILLLGYGLEGKSTKSFLKKFCPDVRIGIGDKKDNKDYLHMQDDFDISVRTPSIHPRNVKEPYTTATNIFFANCPCKVIGITGTKGKSTTAKLLYDVLKSANMDVHLAGNIGEPLLDLLTHESLNSESLVIAELSSYQLIDIEHSPFISVILNIDEAHLNFHNDMDEYRQAKFNIARHATGDAHLIYNSDLKEIDSLETKAQKESLAVENNAAAIVHPDTVAAVHAVLRKLNVDESLLNDALNEYDQLPHRLEKIGVFNDITFIDDSASTVPSATVYALKAIENVDTLIVGGVSRDHSFFDLATAISESNLRNIVLLPDTQEEIVKALGEHSSNYKIFKTDSMEEAVGFCYRNTLQGSVCLLSPGFASYNRYSGFPERGRVFQDAVRQYETKES